MYTPPFQHLRNMAFVDSTQHVIVFQAIELNIFRIKSVNVYVTVLLEWLSMTFQMSTVVIHSLFAHI